nr:MAG TPA: cell division protein [Bacteriophage sp.]
MNMDWFRIALAVILVGESCCVAWLSVKLNRVREDADMLEDVLDNLIDRVRELRDKMAAQSNP